MLTKEQEKQETGIYGSPFYQSPESANGLHDIHVCISVLVGTWAEVSIHIRGIGSLMVSGPQVPIVGFEPKQIIGVCDGSCNQARPGNLRQMRPVTAGLLAKIQALPGYRNLVALADQARRARRAANHPKQ